MPEADELHHADEFGKQPAITNVVSYGTADAAGMLGPGIVQLKGLVEDDDPRHPPSPPSITPGKLALVFGGIFVAGLLLLWVLFVWLVPWAMSALVQLQ